jgi:hypothetical protein
VSVKVRVCSEGIIIHILQTAGNLLLLMTRILLLTCLDKEAVGKLAWVLSDSWLQVDDSWDRADSQQGPYLGRLAFKDSCWYWDWPEESDVGSGGEWEVVSRGSNNSSEDFIGCWTIMLLLP